MATSLVRSRATITGTKDRFTWNEIKDGAVLQEDGVIVAVGTYDDLHRKHPTVPVIGTGKEILLPGFVNGHHHVGLTPVQLGSPDMPLELWFITRMVIRNVDLYLDTLYSAFEMIGSGITTVQHIQGWMPGTLPDVEKRATETIRAYEDVGMRVSYCYAVRDQNRLIYQADDEFVGPIILQVRIDGVERRRRPGTCGIPVPGFRQEVRRVAAVQQRHAFAVEDLARLNDGVVIRVNPRVARGHRGHRIELARHTAVADLTTKA